MADTPPAEQAVTVRWPTATMPDMASIEARGKDGTVTFDGEWLTIARKGLTRNGRGDVRLHVGQITGIEMKAPGMTVGYLTVIAPGAVNPQPGMRARNADALTVAIPAFGDRFGPFVQLRDAVNREIAERQRPHVIQAGPDIAGQLARLAELHAQGALSAEEFTAAKARLIGG